MSKTIAVEVERLRDLYEGGDKKTRAVLEGIYGKEVFQPDDEEMLKRLLEIVELAGDEKVLKWLESKPYPNQNPDAKLEPWVVKDEKGKVAGIGVPLINKMVALNDAYDGKEVEWEKAVKAGAPTRDEWYVILYFKKKIQQLLEENGGEPLKDDYYWSSTECNPNLAWYVYFGNGYVSNTGKYSSYVVRPVAAL